MGALPTEPQHPARPDKRGYWTLGIELGDGWVGEPVRRAVVWGGEVIAGLRCTKGVHL